MRPLGFATETPNIDQDVNMATHDYVVEVRRVPRALSGRHSRIFFDELASSMVKGRCCIVLDCSALCDVDRPAIYKLLRFLEEAIKRDGDMKLACVPAGAKEILEKTGAGRLFESFVTNAEAISSFRRSATYVSTSMSVPFGSHRAPDHPA